MEICTYRPGLGVAGTCSGMGASVVAVETCICILELVGVVICICRLVWVVVICGRMGASVVVVETCTCILE